ncbi:hypothetical protein [Variovorax sp. AFSI2.2]|uniref:hypothetical protein n=1 Tax=Variovorax sp. AFSI2.2 TaxID=3384160 RepID=UPI003EBD667D
MSAILSPPSALRSLILCTVLSVLAGCGANTESAGTAITTLAVPNAAPAKSEPARPVSVMAAFNLVSGSGGNGAVMAELKNHGGQLREPDAKYDVFDTDSSADLKTLKQSIQASLDRDRRVLIDSDGTPESRAKAAQIAYEAIGASLPDITAVVIRKAPEEHGGGLGLIPIYSKADVVEQIAQGKINKPEDLNNSVENFFFEPQKKISP